MAARAPCTRPCSSSPTRLLLMAEMMGNCKSRGPKKMRSKMATCHTSRQAANSNGKTTATARQQRRALTSPKRWVNGFSTCAMDTKAEAPAQRARMLAWLFSIPRYPVKTGVVTTPRPAMLRPESTRMMAILEMKACRVKTASASFAVAVRLNGLRSSNLPALNVSGKTVTTKISFAALATPEMQMATFAGSRAIRSTGAPPMTKTMASTAYAWARWDGSVITSLMKARKTPLVSKAL
mmetsp:Transcript_126678/g.354618  ORF Transcript_126678/g.354618 Transcript_126678/m.354618 type:complete len:238 (+) Transcript_126678:321-1034(+)